MGSRVYSQVLGSSGLGGLANVIMLNDLFNVFPKRQPIESLFGQSIGLVPYCDDLPHLLHVAHSTNSSIGRSWEYKDGYQTLGTRS